MLQWMGGSRRKVTASRNSTQKRQKQYFEQRRRQQQQQPATEEGNYIEGKKTCGQHSENNRSLDIVSLLNLSTVSQEHKSSCFLARNRSENDAQNHQTFQSSPVIQTNEIIPPGPFEIEEARTSSSYQVATAYPKTISVGALGTCEKDLNRDDDKKNPLKMDPEHQLSMIDIVGDEEPNGCVDKSSAHEAHVAFSIEGLGKVETETPVHSPEACGRNLLHGCSSPLEAIKPGHSFKDHNSELVNLECELEAMMQGIDEPLKRSYMEHSFCSQERMDLFSKPKQKLSAFKQTSLFNDNDNLSDLLGDDKLYYRSKQRDDYIWEASSILYGDILDEGGFSSSDKNWTDPIDSSADPFNSMGCRKELFTFEGSSHQKNRKSRRKGGKFEPIESPVPNFEYPKSQNLCNSTFPDMTWHSSFGRPLTDQPSGFVTEDATESLSLRSEESCSSSAVRGAAKRTLSNSKEKRTSRSSINTSHLEKFCDEKKISARDRNSHNQNKPVQWEDRNGRGKFTWSSNPSSSEPVQTASEKRLKPENYTSFGTGTMEHLSPSCRLWIEDLFGTSGDPKFNNHRSSFKRSSMLDLSENSKVGHIPCKPLHTQGCLTPEKESITRDGDESSNIPVTDCANSERRNMQYWTKSSSSENMESNNASLSEDKYSDCKEPSTGTPEMGEIVKEMCCLEDAEETSLSGETSSRLDGNQCNAYRKCQQDAQTPETFLLCQPGLGAGEVEDSGPKERRMPSHGQSTADSTRPVMMLDSCVMQLLCVQVAEVTGRKA